LKNKKLPKIGEYQSIAQKLANATIEVVAKAGESGKLFGSISNIHLAQAIEAQKGVSIERQKNINA
jgi:large subunit ribosomal protein L9